MADDPFTNEADDPFQSVEAPDGGYDPVADGDIPAAGADPLADVTENPGAPLDNPLMDVSAGTYEEPLANLCDAAPAENDAEEDENVTFLSVWEEQRKQTLEERRLKEEEAKKALAAKAQEDLAEFHKKRRADIEKNKKAALTEEGEFKDSMEKVFKEGTTWQQVAKMVQLKADSERPERMRDILIQLKNEA